MSLKFEVEHGLRRVQQISYLHESTRKERAKFTDQFDLLAQHIEIDIEANLPSDYKGG